MSQNKSLGKLTGLYGASPVAMQRAAVVALLSFVFFIVMLFIFYLRQQIGYFMLSSVFLVVHLLTLTGMWMRRKSFVRVYSEGIAYKKTTLFWSEIVSADISREGSLDIVYNEDGNDKTLVIPSSINNFENLTNFIRTRIRKADQQ